jgi:hypothetical protein
MELSPVEEVVPEMAHVREEPNRKAENSPVRSVLAEIIRGDTGFDGEDAEQCA